MACDQCLEAALGRHTTVWTSKSAVLPPRNAVGRVPSGKPVFSILGGTQ